MPVPTPLANVRVRPRRPPTPEPAAAGAAPVLLAHGAQRAFGPGAHRAVAGVLRKTRCARRHRSSKVPVSPFPRREALVLDLRPWNHPDDTARLQALAERLWPLSRHPGGIGWEAATRQRRPWTRLAERDGVLVGWAEAEGTEMEIYGSCHDAEAGAALLARALDTVAETPSTGTGGTAGTGGSGGTGAPRLMVRHGDEVLLSLAAEAGFTPDT